MEQSDTIVVAGICGSLRQGSYTRMALQVALRGAADAGARTQLLDLAEYSLVFAGREGEPEPEGVLALRRQVKDADGIILGTPEYHGSFSGVLKNALDLMGFAEFEGKMLGLVGVSGGHMGAFHALNSLRDVGRALHAWVVPEQASLPEAWKVFDDAGGVKDKELEDRLLTVGRQVARFARLHKCAEATEFLKRWEAAPANPGGE
jgi:NAD(P)H-dependent FMN reductase